MRKGFVVALLVVSVAAELTLSIQLMKAQRELLRAEMVIGIQQMAIRHHIAVYERKNRAHSWSHPCSDSSLAPRNPASR